MTSYYQKQLIIHTLGRSTIELTQALESVVREAGFTVGLAHAFLKHTSASLMLCENADSTVRDDLETIMQRLAPDADPEYLHNYEGDDDMAAHVRSVLTTNEVTIPIVDGELGLGAWQGIYLWEHRDKPHSRQLVITVNGN